MKTFIDAFFHV